MHSKHAPSTPLSPAEVDRLIHVHYPQAHVGGQLIFIEDLSGGVARLRMKMHDRIVRPGGTVSGPALFLLADIGIYVALLAEMGEGGLQAVTTTLTINFLSRPGPVDVLCETRLIKRGRRLVVGEVELRSEGSPDLIAHATGTYALPPAGLKV